MAKSTRITIESDSLLILWGSTTSRSWCTRCVEEVEMIALEATSVASNLAPHELEKWINTGDLHRSQTSDGTELICLNSLLARLGSR